MKVDPEKIWNNVLASDFVAVLFISGTLEEHTCCYDMDGQTQGSSGQQGQGYVGLAVVIYQPNHISSSFLRR